jgi:hypothetical protein
MKIFTTLLAFALLFANAMAQEDIAGADTIRKNALNVYFPDADNYIKKEIQFINYVRDLKEADVYIITALEETGSGGMSVTVFMVGQHNYSGMNDTIRIVASPDDTDDVFRRKAVNILKMGFMRYVLRTPLSEFFEVRFTQPVKETVETDKWNNWVFRTSLSGSLSGERSYKATSLHGSTSVNRVTEKSKFQNYISYSWSKQKYQMNDSTYMYSDNNSQNLSIYYVKSLNDHWSAGFSTGMSRSSYGYYDFSYRLTPAIEYDIYPYSESTRRQLRIMYEVGYNYFNYSDTTIYNKMTEHLALHELSASWELIQKWGSLDFTVQWRNYFHDWSKNNLGVSLYISASIVNDQLSLPKGGISDFDIITRNRMTQTKFDYSGYFGFSYTFGSIYNNAVNPRFGW